MLAWEGGVVEHAKFGAVHRVPIVSFTLIYRSESNGRPTKYELPIGYIIYGAIKLARSRQPFKVTQGHRNRHGSICCLWLPISDHTLAR